MSDPFIGEIRMFAGNFAPRSWALCDGQLLNVSQNDALFSLFGTIYGGDGRTTFGLPELRGRLPMHAGSGPGLTNRRLGAKGGQETVTLTQNQMPQHTHTPQATSNLGDTANPGGKVVAQSSTVDAYFPDVDTPANMNASSITSVGGSQQHSNLMPFQVVHFIVALQGIYPTRQ